MDESLKSKLDNITVGEVLDLFLLNMLINPEQDSDDASSIDVNDDSTDDSSDARKVFKKLKLMDAISAHGVLIRLREVLSVPDSYTNKDVFNRIYIILELLFDKKSPKPSSLEEITTWLNETGSDFNLPSINENIPDNVINLSDFIAQRTKD